MSEADDSDTSCEEKLAASLLEVDALRVENEQLLKASNDFGQLAERLNNELRQERRRGQDRRRWPRIGATERRVARDAT